MKKILMMFALFSLMLCNVVCARTQDEAIYIVRDGKLMQGSDKGFEAQKNLTRAELTTIVVRMKGLDEEHYSVKCFEDVPSDHWAYNYINVAYKNGVVKGDGTGNFNPNLEISANETIAIIIRAIADTSKIDETNYPKAHVDYARELNFLEGIPKNTEEKITRGEVAMILANIATSEMWQEQSEKIENIEKENSKEADGIYLDIRQDGENTKVKLATPSAVLEYIVGSNELLPGTLIPGTYLNYCVVEDEIWDVEPKKLIDLRENQNLYKVVKIGDGTIELVSKESGKVETYTTKNIIFVSASETNWIEENGMRVFENLKYEPKMNLKMVQKVDKGYDELDGDEAFCYIVEESGESKVVAVIYITK